MSAILSEAKMGLFESSMIIVLSQFVGHLSKTNVKYLARQHSLQTKSVAIPAVLKGFRVIYIIVQI